MLSYLFWIFPEEKNLILIFSWMWRTVICLWIRRKSSCEDEILDQKTRHTTPTKFIRCEKQLWKHIMMNFRVTAWARHSMFKIVKINFIFPTLLLPFRLHEAIYFFVYFSQIEFSRDWINYRQNISVKEYTNSIAF